MTTNIVVIKRAPAMQEPLSPPFLMWLKAKVEPWGMLKHETALYTIRPASDDNQRCHEANSLEVLTHFVCIPNFAMFHF